VGEELLGVPRSERAQAGAVRAERDREHHGPP
jgi:hypothetical protein